MSRKKAFTLIELLVVVSIIALLVSILLPSLGKAREQARLAVCLSNLHQLGVANFSYAMDNDDWYLCLSDPKPWNLETNYPQSDVPYALVDNGNAKDQRAMLAPYMGFEPTLGSDVFYCPSTPGVSRKDFWYETEKIRAAFISYCIFSNYKMAQGSASELPFPAAGAWVSYSDIPTKVGRTQPGTTIMGDHTYGSRSDGLFLFNHGPIPNSQRKLNYAEIFLVDARPDGANLALADGSARWDDFADMEQAISPPLLQMSERGWYWGIPAKGGEKNDW